MSSAYDPLVNKDDSMTERTRRSHMNDLENIFPFALVAVAYMFASLPDILNPGTRVWNEIVGVIMLSWFTFSRILYTIFYALQLQPWRSFAFVSGNLTALILGIYAVVLAFIPFPSK
jgi:uncharacterized MAPEG superfamily protein